VLLARWDGTRFELDVVHRFANGPVDVPGRQYWDVLRLWAEIKDGLARYVSQYGVDAASVGVDTWGVDYGLLDATGQLLGNPVHYRDVRTVGVPEIAFSRVSRAEIFAQTGLQFMELNTLFQLYAMRIQGDPQLDMASRLLLMPDLMHYWMTGEQVAEYTIASTTQMLHAEERRWATGLLANLGCQPSCCRPSSSPAPYSARCCPMWPKRWASPGMCRSLPPAATTQPALWPRCRAGRG
jgi:rhamnulokinase